MAAIPLKNTADLQRADTTQLIAELHKWARAGGDGRRKAAVDLIAGYNDGTILENTAVRRFLAIDAHTSTVYLRFGSLGEELAKEESPLNRLNSTARHAIGIACALDAGTPIAKLGSALEAFGKHNSRVVLDAFATALGVDLKPAAPGVSLAAVLQAELIRAGDEGVDAYDFAAGQYIDRMSVITAMVSTTAVMPTPHGRYYLPECAPGYQEFLTAVADAGSDGVSAEDVLVQMRANGFEPSPDGGTIAAWSERAVRESRVVERGFEDQPFLYAVEHVPKV